MIRSLAALLFACGLAEPGAAAVVSILPIQIGDGAGTYANATQELFLTATNQIWSQAGITFEYLPFTTYDSSTFFTLDDQEEVDSLFALAPGASSVQTTITMWFVADHFDAYGEANGLGGLSSNLIVISESVFTEGRLDTIAHELGHLLGLDHDDVGVETDFLMRSGEDRLTPTVIGDIYPNGAGLDRLTEDQINIAFSDPKVLVPEPSSLVLGIGGLAVAFVRRRRNGLAHA